MGGSSLLGLAVAPWLSASGDRDVAFAAFSATGLKSLHKGCLMAPSPSPLLLSSV